MAGGLGGKTGVSGRHSIFRGAHLLTSKGICFRPVGGSRSLDDNSQGKTLVRGYLRRRMANRQHPRDRPTGPDTSGSGTAVATTWNTTSFVPS